MGFRDPRARATGRDIGRYVLHGEIASGGMATVYFGRLSGPVGFSRTVAIKRLHPQYARDPEFVTMFLDEARLAGRVRHPNVVPTLDVVAVEGEIFLVMEYVQGESLSRLARSVKMQGQHMPPRMVATVMSGVLHGLHAAHEAKDEHGHPLSIVHRDVSPQNILVGTDGNARVLDFGVAKAAGRLQTTRAGVVKGKVSYMAPEQLNGGHVTRAADIYAASVVLWECLVGQRLYQGDNDASIVVRALEGRVDAPSTLVSGLPADIDAVVLRGLARDPAQRFASARDMALALESAFGVVAPSETGEWVEAVAGAELTKRAATVAEIESRSLDAVSDRTWPEPGQILAPSSGPQVSPTSVSGNGPSSRGTSERRLRLPLVILLTATASVAAVLALLPAVGRAGSADPSSAAAVSPVAFAPPPAASASSATAAAPPGQTVDAAASSAAPLADALTPATASAAPIVGSTRPRRVSEPPVAHHAERKATNAARCDPPYTVDDQGHKMYKMECLSP